MVAAKSRFVAALDEVQARLRLVLRRQGFRVRGRTFNRDLADGLVQVVNLQLGSLDPPGTVYVPGVTRDLHGHFTVNLGVYVPEVAQHHVGVVPRGVVQDYHCVIGARLGELGHDPSDLWWSLDDPRSSGDEIVSRMERDAASFFAGFTSRDALLENWIGLGDPPFAIAPARITCAIILHGRGRSREAAALLARQALETHNPGHPEYVRGLAARLGLGDLDAVTTHLP